RVAPLSVFLPGQKPVVQPEETERAGDGPDTARTPTYGGTGSEQREAGSQESGTGVGSVTVLEEPHPADRARRPSRRSAPEPAHGRRRRRALPEVFPLLHSPPSCRSY